jgi:hypothetical protein
MHSALMAVPPKNTAAAAGQTIDREKDDTYAAYNL